MFDVGQKVICVRKEPWRIEVGSGGFPVCPSFGDECTVDGVLRKGQSVRVGPLRTIKLREDVVGLVEYGGCVTSIFDAKWFRPKEPNIEALRSLLVSKKQTEKV